MKDNFDVICTVCDQRKGKHFPSSNWRCPAPLRYGPDHRSWRVFTPPKPVVVQSPCPTCGHKVPRVIKQGDIVENRQTGLFYTVVMIGSHTGKVTGWPFGGKGVKVFPPSDLNVVTGQFQVTERIEP